MTINNVSDVDDDWFLDDDDDTLVVIVMNLVLTKLGVDDDNQ